MVSQWSVGNKTVQSLMIGNKEVQSIVRVSDNAVLYEKVASHSYALAFSSASYQTDSSGDVTVSCTLTDNGVAVSGETVSFSDGSSVYTGLTNNNGVATLQYHCESNKTLTATYSNASATCNVTSNYSPSYTGVLSFTPTSLTLVIDPSIPYDEIGQSYMVMVAGVSIEELIDLGEFGSATVANINESEYTTMDLIQFYGLGLTGFDLDPINYTINSSNDLINDYEVDYLPVIRAMDGAMEEEYTVTYTATSATSVTITISR